jgi:molybdopterin converting factor small subunit
VPDHGLAADPGSCVHEHARPNHRPGADSRFCPGSRVDRKDLFYAKVKARNGIPASEARLPEEIATLKARNEALRQERDDYRTATETFTRAIHVLTVENDNFRKELDKRRSFSVTALPSRR